LNSVLLYIVYIYKATTFPLVSYRYANHLSAMTGIRSHDWTLKARSFNATAQIY